MEEVIRSRTRTIGRGGLILESVALSIVQEAKCSTRQIRLKKWRLDGHGDFDGDEYENLFVSSIQRFTGNRGHI